MSIHIYNKARKAVAFAMYKTKTVGGRIVDKTDAAANVKRYLQTMTPEGTVNGCFFIERQYTHCYAANLYVSPCQEIPFGRHHAHHFPFIGMSFNMMDSSAEHPWVETQKRLFFASFQYDDSLIFHLHLF